MSLEVWGLILLGFMLTFIFIGFPVSFSLIILGLVFGYIALGNRVFYLITFQVMTTMTEYVLAAVTLFLLMGYLLERSGLMIRLFHAVQLLAGGMKGSLYLAALVSATLFAAATGIVTPGVVIIGLMAGPRMRASKYDTRLSAGAITAGGTLGILIPPSIMLVVMGPVLEVSIVRLFAGAFLPGLMLSSLFIGYCLIRSALKPSLGPALPLEERSPSLAYSLRELALGLIPITTVIMATLGSILTGFATPTEGAALGVVGALILVASYRRLNWGMFKESVFRTAETAAMILVLIAASNFLGSVFSRLGTPGLIADSLLGLNLPPMAYLGVILVILFILGWPLEWVPIVVIILPMFLPLVNALGFNMVWFSITVAVTLQTCWLSPPVALSAYYIKSVVPEWSLKDIFLGMAQFMVLQVGGVALIVFFPQIVLFLPNLWYGG
jgi:tripartite ATP-independent transporter DctM subunit